MRAGIRLGSQAVGAAHGVTGDNRVGRRVSRSNEPVDGRYSIVCYSLSRDNLTRQRCLALQFTNTPTSQLASTVSKIFTDHELKAIPGSRLFLIDLAPELNGRRTLVRALLTKYVSPLIGVLPAGRASATTGVFGSLSLICPASLVLTPFVCGVAASRARVTGLRHRTDGRSVTSCRSLCRRRSRSGPRRAAAPAHA